MWPGNWHYVLRLRGSTLRAGTKSGRQRQRFYASAAGKLKGPLVNQADILPDFANPTFQDHANEAIHRFITQ
jgi:hypothetical protein